MISLGRKVLGEEFLEKLQNEQENNNQESQEDSQEG